MEFEMVDQEINPVDGTENQEIMPEIPANADENSGLYKLSQEKKQKINF